MNSVGLIGRLTKNIEVTSLQTGNKVASFTLAINRKFKNGQGEYEADFINCIAWNKTAEILAEYFFKGSQIGINGRLQTRRYENKNNEMVYVTEVVVEEFTFVGSSNKKHQANNQHMPTEYYIPE